MDNVAATLILAPILIPVGIALGCNELHIGMLFCICLVVGFVTPPFGYNSVYGGFEFQDLNFKQIVKGASFRSFDGNIASVCICICTGNHHMASETNGVRILSIRKIRKKKGL